MKIATTEGKIVDTRRIRREVMRSLKICRRIDKRIGRDETTASLLSSCMRELYRLKNRPSYYADNCTA